MKEIEIESFVKVFLCQLCFFVDNVQLARGAKRKEGEIGSFLPVASHAKLTNPKDLLLIRHRIQKSSFRTFYKTQLI